MQKQLPSSSLTNLQIGETLEITKARPGHSESALEEVQKRVVWKPVFVIEGEDAGDQGREASVSQNSY